MSEQENQEGELANMPDEDLREMILYKQELILTREKQIKDMSMMINDCTINQQKVEQLNIAHETQLQEGLLKFEQRQLAMKALLRTKEDAFIKLQKLQKEVDELNK